MTPADPPSPYDRVPPPAPPRGGDAMSAAPLTRQQIQGNRPRTPAEKPRQRKKRNRKVIWARRVVVLVVVLAVVVAGIGAYIWFFIGNPHRIPVSGLQTGQDNILLVGSTTRCGLTKPVPGVGTCAEGVTGVNSDIVMIVHLNITTGKVSLLSIPRDLFVPNARPNGQYGQPGNNKIDSALVDSPSQLVAAIEEDFGIGINHYVELNFDTFINVVNTLGGVKMYFPDPLFDAESGLNVKTTGCLALNGLEALEVVRARHLQFQPKGHPTNFIHQDWPQEALSDLARIQRTHEFLRIVAEKIATEHNIFDVTTDVSLAAQILPNLTVDSGWSKSDMAHLALDFAGTHILNVPQYTYPVVTVETGEYLYQGFKLGDVEFPVQPGGYNAVNTIFDVKPGLNSFTGKPLPDPKTVKLTVLNGTSDTSVAGFIAGQLGKRHFRVTGTGSQTPSNPQENETIVWYGGPPPPKHSNWKSPDLAAAEAVEQQLEGPVVLGWNPSMITAGDQVALVVGNDVSMAPKISTTTTTTTSSTSTTTSTTQPHSGTTTSTTSVTPTTVADPPGIRTDPLVSSPTNLSSPLTWYDPRSCNAAGTGPGSY
jgi:LCP family protein required for cell wall assembly